MWISGRNLSYIMPIFLVPNHYYPDKFLVTIRNSANTCINFLWLKTINLSKYFLEENKLLIQ